ncbi:MAG: hypothetical protein ACRDIU_09410, partial [Actinomycetota bacterium]
MDTIAGPGFCEGRGGVDPTSTLIRGLSSDASGFMYFITGPDDKRLVARVDPQSRVTFVDVPDLRNPRQRRGPPANAELSGSTMASDGTGGLFLALGNTLMRIQPSGAYEPVAGPFLQSTDKEARSSGDGGPARDARFKRILAVVADRSGNLFVADEAAAGDAFRVRLINRSAGEIRAGGSAGLKTIAPGHIDTVESIRGDGPVLEATSGRLYAAYREPHKSVSTIRLVNLSSETISAHGNRLDPARSVVLTARQGRGPSQLARIKRPPAMAGDAQGSLFVADESGDRILEIDVQGRLSTFAGGIGRSFNGNDRKATLAALNRPNDLAIAATGELLISDAGNRQIRLVDSSGTIRSGPGANAGLTWDCGGASNSGPAARPSG